MYTFDSDVVSDLHKSAFGSRPSQGFWLDWEASSSDEKQQTWDTLVSFANARAEEEQAQMDAAAHDFEMRVLSLKQCGAKNRRMAIRWIVESLELTESDMMYGGEYICFKLNLPYSYQIEFDRAINTMERV